MMTLSLYYWESNCNSGMAKVLWYGDACCNTGFARVTHSVLDHLYKDHEVCVVGINATGDPHNHPYSVFPAGNINCPDRFGIARLPEILQKAKPDIVICCQDIWVVNNVWERIQFLQNDLKFKFLAYFPTDSEAYLPDMLRNMTAWDMCLTFTIPSANKILASGVQPRRFGVLPHGVDISKFSPGDKTQARKNLGLPEDKFIVLNANRNQPRKRIDLTIEAFVEFSKGRPDTMLYLHMSAKDLGWDVIGMFRQAMTISGQDPENRLILTSQNINYGDAPPDSLLENVYRAADVGINTADGEGWGLVSFEHAACKRPQIVGNHTACKDIWEKSAQLINVGTYVWDKDLTVKRGVIDTRHAAGLLRDLYEDRGLYEHTAEACYAVTQRPEYRWENVAAGFNAAILELV